MVYRCRGGSAVVTLRREIVHNSARFFTRSADIRFCYVFYLFISFFFYHFFSFLFLFFVRLRTYDDHPIRVRTHTHGPTIVRLKMSFRQVINVLALVFIRRGTYALTKMKLSNNQHQ
jgi:hypothetical protein